jgi:cobalamin biosynthetic protein CobC
LPAGPEHEPDGDQRSIHKTAQRSVQHGGDLDAARRRFGECPDGWLDLSTGINPHAYDPPPPAPEAWRRLPQSGAEAALIEAARKAYGTAAGARIVAAPGTQAIIQAMPRLRAAGQAAGGVAVLGPTYNEHAHAWRAAGYHVRDITTLDEIGDADVIVIVNPNNPDGRVIDRGTLRALRDSTAKRGGWLVIDEAFADTDPAVSVAAEAGRAGLIVLRSFGKFFGLAGLRLGFALTDDRTADALAAALGPWAVSGPALEIGRVALADGKWCETMRGRLAEDARRLDALFAASGFKVAGGTSLFRLIETGNAARLHERLAERGILVRIFDGRPTRMRVGLPPDGAAFDRLAAALANSGPKISPGTRRTGAVE